MTLVTHARDENQDVARNSFSRPDARKGISRYISIYMGEEPDPEFIASAREAFNSEEVQQTLQQLGERFDPQRTYPHAQKA